MIADETIELVREHADIVQIIGEYVNLRRTGADYRGACPFHQGKSRNLSVSPRRRMFYCFVCHEGGDVFAFLQKHLGVEWPSAVRLAAEKTGIEVKETDKRREGPDPREPLWEVNATAAEYFSRQLWEDAGGADAREYLGTRRVTREMADRFALGLAPRDAAAMRAHLERLGFSEERMLAAGVLSVRESTGEIVPRFRGRLIFPIFDAAGHVVGFGGRALGRDEPKYLNSGETSIFSKGRLLYGLNWARSAIRTQDRVIVVEGFFDVLRLASAGIATVVAPLGTALTDTQAALLRRATPNVFLLYDGDEPGLKATFRAGDELLRQGASVRVVSLPEGQDPDSFVQSYGAAALEAQIAASLDIFERRIRELERKGWFAQLHKRRRAIDKLLPTIRITADPVMRESYVARASEASGVSRDTILAEVTQPAPGVPRAGPTPESGAAPAPGWNTGDDAPTAAVFPRGFRPEWRRGGRPRPPQWASSMAPMRARSGRSVGAERELVRVMLHFPAEVEKIAEQRGPEHFRDATMRAIFAAMLQLGPEAGIEALTDVLTPTETAAVQALLEQPDAVAHAAAILEDSLAQLDRRDLKEQLATIDASLAIAPEDAKDALVSEKSRITRQLVELGGVNVKRHGRT